MSRRKEQPVILSKIKIIFPERKFLFRTEKIDAVFEKVGTGATLRAVREKLAENGCFADCFVAKPDERKIQTDHLIFSAADVGFVWPHDNTEYKNNFEKVLWDTERLSELNYAKLSLFCAVEWMKNNPRKNAFVFIGD